MKISAIICEFNPFHNGHEYILSRARELCGGDAYTVCVMSGSFTQRGEICRVDKYLRAKHAILSGADAVIELPAPFAVAPAEIFARGAIKVIAALKQEATLVFGCEDRIKESFMNAVTILSSESEKFKAKLAENLEDGESYIRSYAAAFEACGGEPDILSAPNNILGVEYLKAMKAEGLDLRFMPVKRAGADYHSRDISEGNFASAAGIRANASNGAIKSKMPLVSYNDFVASTDNERRFKNLAADWLYLCEKADLKRVFGCTEGLENRLKSLAFGNGFDQILEEAASKRYSKARISRILCANMLKLYSDDTQKFLSAPPPVKVLAVKKQCADKLLPVLSAADADRTAETEQCAAVTSRTYSLWRYLSTPLICDNHNEKMIIV